MSKPDFGAVLADYKAAREDEEVRAQMQRAANEHRFAEMLVDYITEGSKQFTYGGIVNVLTELQEIMEQLGRDTDCADYFTAADALGECAKVCDLRYAEAE